MSSIPISSAMLISGPGWFSEVESEFELFSQERPKVVLKGLGMEILLKNPPSEYPNFSKIRRLDELCLGVSCSPVK